MSPAPTSKPSPAADFDDASADLASLARAYRLEVLTAVPDEMLDPALVAKLSVKWARDNAMLPVRRGAELCVLTCEPAAVAAQKHLALLLGRDLTPLLAARALVLQSIERCYVSRPESARDFLRELGEPADAAASAARRSDDLLLTAEHAPVTQLINLILLEAIKAGASDIHVEPFESRLRVRYRIDGLLYEQAAPPKHMEPALVSRLKVMAHMDIAERRLPQDGVARVRIGEREIDIRVSTIPVAEGERVVLRLLNRSATLLPLAGLGLSPSTFRQFESVLQTAHGIFIVSGPTGSGKTTTLYAALQQLDKAHTNILTIEDPIEYQLPDIGQIQVKPKIGLTFAGGLRHILRQDPDTILVGEIRDAETADIAIRASLTGHRVFTTLHTNDAPGAATRLMDMGIEPFLLASCLRAVLAQRLVRTLCPACRAPVAAAVPEAAWPEALRRRVAGRPVWRATGCQVCLEGYRGRTGLFELMIVTAELAEALRGGAAQSRVLAERAAAQGMTTLLDDGVEKILAGATSVAEVLRTLGH